MHVETSTRSRYFELITMESEGKSLSYNENPDIVALQETKIDSNIKSNELVPEYLEYDIYRNDRTANGGGIMLLVKTYLKSAPLRKVENGSESS
jgi:exonuclease III